MVPLNTGNFILYVARYYNIFPKPNTWGLPSVVTYSGLNIFRTLLASGLLRRNLSGCPIKLREQAYIALIRSRLEYCSAVWDPHLKKDINSVEAVQHRAARFTVQDYRYSSSVTAMLSDLNWLLLKDRRKDIRLDLLFQIIRGKISAEAENILLKPDSRTRKKHNSTYRHLRPHTEQYRQSFFVTTIIDWNNLSEACVNADTITAFKAQLCPLPHP